MKSEIASTRAGSENSATTEDALASIMDSALSRKTMGANSATNEETRRKAAPNLPSGPARWSHGLEVG
jgi:hypothetical protein